MTSGPSQEKNSRRREQQVIPTRASACTHVFRARHAEIRVRMRGHACAYAPMKGNERGWEKRKNNRSNPLMELWGICGLDRTPRRWYRRDTRLMTVTMLRLSMMTRASSITLSITTRASESSVQSSPKFESDYGKFLAEFRFSLSLTLPFSLFLVL